MAEEIPEGAIPDIDVVNIIRVWDDDKDQYRYEVDIADRDCLWSIGLLHVGRDMLARNVKVMLADGSVMECYTGDCGECITCCPIDFEFEDDEEP